MEPSSFCSSSIRSCPAVHTHVKAASSPIRKSHKYRQHGEPKDRVQPHSAPKSWDKILRTLNASIRLSLPVDIARKSLADKQDLCSGSRTKGIEIMVQLADAYRMKDTILAFAMALQDMFLAANTQDCNSAAEAGADTFISNEDGCNTEQIAMACFMLANKFVGSSLLRIDDVSGVVRLKCSSAQIESTEGKVLSSIDWSLHFTTGQEYLKILRRAARLRFVTDKPLGSL
jgi:hypothetical protein